MRIIIAPAKKMVVDTDSFAVDSLPQFLEQTERLKAVLQSMSPQDLQALWKCNDSIAKLNIERLDQMDLRRNLTPAILSYEGIQYRYMAPSVMETTHLDYLREHLRILSGFYGLLRPFDGVTPYRLEMQAKLAVDGCREFGLQGVQQSGGGLSAQNRPVRHLCLWRAERRQGRRKRHQMQNGPGTDGTLAGGESNQKPGGSPGL